jgi:hypothetical protein
VPTCRLTLKTLHLRTFGHALSLTPARYRACERVFGFVCTRVRRSLVHYCLYGCLRLTRAGAFEWKRVCGPETQPCMHGTRTTTALMHDSSGSWPSMPPATCDAYNAVVDVGVFSETNHALFSFCSRVCHNSQCLHSSHTTAAVCVCVILGYWASCSAVSKPQARCLRLLAGADP